MSREDFLQGLENSLSGNVPPAVVRDNLHYYSDYIRTEMEKGRSETEIMEELGDPRLIAKTIMDTTPNAGETVYEEYHPYGSYNRTSGENRRYEDPNEGAYQKNSVHYYDLSKWYWKLLSVVLVIAVVTVVITVVTGLLSLVIPILPVIGLVILIMWFVRGSGR